MRFKVEKIHLVSAIQTVQNIVTSKSALPILSNILIEAQNDSLRLTATDLDVGITCVIPVENQEQGAITIPAKRFSDIIKEFPSDVINITTKKNNQVVIDSEACQFKVMGLAKEEFPKLPEFKEKKAIKIDAVKLDDFLADKTDRVDVAKIDIEGAEALAVEGMKNILNKNRNIKILMEFFPLFIKKMGNSPEKLVKILMEELKFNIFVIGHDYSMEKEKNDFVKIEKIEDLMALIKDKESHLNLYISRETKPLF